MNDHKLFQSISLLLSLALLPSSRYIYFNNNAECRGSFFFAIAGKTRYVVLGLLEITLRFSVPDSRLLAVYSRRTSLKHASTYPLPPINHMMNELPLNRNDDDGEIHLAGIGAVSLQIIYDSVLGRGGHGVVFMGKIFRETDSRLVMKVSGIVCAWCVCRPAYSALGVKLASTESQQATVPTAGFHTDLLYVHWF